LCFW